MRGILMIKPLYHQTIAGKKTMTRRSGGLEKANESPDDWTLQPNGMLYNYKTFYIVLFKPRYKVGEVLYIKEPYTWIGKLIKYKFDLSPESTERLIKWENKLFMKADYGRAFIRITGIKCERLMDISDEDCIAEGIEYDKHTGWLNYDKKGEPKTHAYGSPKNSFISLYKFANKVKEVPNIWVFCYEFEYLPNYKL